MITFAVFLTAIRTSLLYLPSICRNPGHLLHYTRKQSKCIGIFKNFYFLYFYALNFSFSPASDSPDAHTQAPMPYVLSAYGSGIHSAADKAHTHPPAYRILPYRRSQSLQSHRTTLKIHDHSLKNPSVNLIQTILITSRRFSAKHATS